MTERIMRVGEITEIMTDEGVEWAVIEFSDRKPDILSVPTSILEASGIYIEPRSAIAMYVNPDAANEGELDPVGFHQLEPIKVAQIQNNRGI